MEKNINYQLGLLHLVHLLVNVDGHLDDREQEAIKNIRKEEGISDSVFQDFVKKIEGTNEDHIYTTGIGYLTQCSEEEKLTIFVHLYKLAESDSTINPKEIRLLFYGLKDTKLTFEDVVMSAGMSGSKFFTSK